MDIVNDYMILIKSSSDKLQLNSSLSIIFVVVVQFGSHHHKMVISLLTRWRLTFLLSLSFEHINIYISYFATQNY